jgi:PAS domain S-box-containing protein
VSPWRSPVRAPELGELDALVACAAEGSLVAAAERLGISRPAVAKRIKNLEALAGRPLLHRGGRGVRLTDAGAALLAGARRMLDERDAMVGLLREIRGDGASAIAGLRELLGHSPEVSRAAQRAEARLAETERVLELVLRASATGVAISDPNTSVIHEVNDAFCRFVGRSRADLLGKPATETGTWFDPRERPAIVEQLRRTGALDHVLVRVKRPDGTIRDGETSVSLIPLAGASLALSTIDDITERRRIGLEHAGTLFGYRAITALAAHILNGQPLLSSVVDVLPELRRSGRFATAMLWELESGRPTLVEGHEPWPELAHDLTGAHAPQAGTVKLLKPASPSEDAEIGFAVALPELGQAIVLLSARILPESAQALACDILKDFARIVEAAGEAVGSTIG